MGVPATITIKDGRNGKSENVYYYYSDYYSYEEALDYAKRIKKERIDMKGLRYFILASQEGWLLPEPKYIVYLNRRLRVL